MDHKVLALTTHHLPRTEVEECAHREEYPHRWGTHHGCDSQVSKLEAEVARWFLASLKKQEVKNKYFTKILTRTWSGRGGIDTTIPDPPLIIIIEIVWVGFIGRATWGKKPFSHSKQNKEYLRV